MSGLWIAVGVNPEAEITNAFAQAASSILAGSGILIWLIPILCLVFSILGAFSTGGRLGLLAVGIAFFGGIIFIHYTIPSLILVGIAIVIGFFVSSK